MNMEVRQRPAEVAVGVVDCDVHPVVRSWEDFRPYLTNQWWSHLQTYGLRPRHGFAKGVPYPKITPLATRRDAWPEQGPPGSDLALMQRQHLDAYGVEMGVLNPLTPNGGNQNSDLSAALASAANEWQVDAFTSKEPRLKASIVIPYEDGEASAAEIRRCAGKRDYVQVLVLSRTSEPFGKKRYWPIFEAAVEHDLPVAIHVFGYSGWPMTSSGWPSFYLEEGAAHPASCQASLASLIFEGVFERFPTLKIIIVEAGFAWLPALAWRLDKSWARMRDEVPHVRRPPSEYLRKHVWLTTQPMEEAENRKHLADVIDWIGVDRLMFASDYPHWDFDDPSFAVPFFLPKDQQTQIRSGNARAVYRTA
jgi:predicted TIM-barrel fold metal-dependent hydrolase